MGVWTPRTVCVWGHFNCHVVTLRMMECFGGCEYKQGCNTGGSAHPRTSFVTVSFSLGTGEYSQLFHAPCLCMRRFHHVWTLMIRVWRSCTDRVDLRFFCWTICLYMHWIHHVWTWIIRETGVLVLIELIYAFFAGQFVSICIGSTMFGPG